ncbi:MAG TPA: nuclear transport factor 2 family protein [Acidimicrobiia bacterium]|jgi:hypothetical protein
MDGSEREAMVAVALAHAAAEADRDIEATMGTLDDDPVYELQPMGRMLRGRDSARAYYEHFFAECQPRISDYELRSEWITDEGVLQEYTLQIAGGDGTTSRHAIIGILTFGTGGKLSGERIYASDDLLRLMFGPVLDQAAPL